MNWEQDLAGESREVQQAVQNFKASMEAWSDAALSRPRTAAPRTARHTWRMAAGWALGCVMAAGVCTGAVQSLHHRQQMARVAAQKAEQRAAEERAAEAREAAQEANAKAAKTELTASAKDADLLASVDRAISRPVPEAMEPLAQLMDDSEGQ